MKKPAAVFILAAFVAITATPLEAQKPGKRPPPPIEIAKVVQKELSTKLLLFGNIHAGKSATVRTEARGAVMEFKKEVGDRLTKGEIVARIDAESYQIALDIARSALKRAEVALEKARLNEGRLEKLHREQIIPMEQYQEKVLDSKMAEAEVALKKSETDRARRDLRLTAVTAPYGGFLAAKHIQRGDFTQAGDPVFNIVSLSSVYATVVLPEKDLSTVKVKSKAKLWMDAYPGVKFEGTVTRIAPKASVKSRDFDIRIDFSDKKGLVRDGMFVRVEMLSKSRSVLMAPKDAIVERGQMKMVFKIKENIASKVIVSVLRQKGDMVEVEGKLEAGDELAVTGNEILRDGVPVNVTLRR